MTDDPIGRYIGHTEFCPGKPCTSYVDVERIVDDSTTADFSGRQPWHCVYISVSAEERWSVAATAAAAETGKKVCTVTNKSR